MDEYNQRNNRPLLPRNILEDLGNSSFGLIFIIICENNFNGRHDEEGDRYVL